jgi:hypothetical protein
MLQWLYTYVSSIDSKCFICFRRVLQVFHLDIVKVDLDVAYICKCLKRFNTYVASVFICMFAMATHEVSSFSGLSQVFQTYIASVSNVLNVRRKCFI